MLITVAILASFAVPANGHAAVVINEISYHILNSSVPAGEDPERLEFIELYNTGPGAVDLSGWSFSQGVTYTFPPATSLAAGQYLVVAADPAALAQWGQTIPGGVRVVQWTSGANSLDNAGETITLLNATLAVVDTVTFDDAGLWPGAADGRGPTLELINPTYDNTYPLVWKASLATNGTPGQTNGRFTEGPAVLWDDPPRTSVVPDLTQVRVMFAESVTGVVASDLKVAASPATSVTGSGAGPYVFTGFAAPTDVTVNVTLGPGAIQDLQGHVFAGDAWIYSLSVPKVVINEIHYNPNTSDDMEEFLEITNADSVAVDISGWTLTEFASPGVTFPLGTVIQPGAYIVAAKDRAALFARLGCSTAYEWGAGDSLSNSGEPVALRDANGVLVDRVYYDDDPPWPTSPDGGGPSLERTNPTAGTPCTEATQASCTWQASAWKASLATNGTCGAQNSVYSNAPLVSTTDPARGALVMSLTQVSVTFSEAVTDVTADDLTVDGVAATNVTGSGTGPYVFTVIPPAPGTLEVVLRSDGGIQDLQSVPFAGDSWLYFYGLPKIVINELQYHPAVFSVLAGENAENLQFLELYNAGTTTVDLSGFALSEGVALTFPAGTTMAPGAFLVVAENVVFLRSKVTIPAGVTVLQWTSGNLANGGELVELVDSYGHVLDSVPYDDGGEWSSVPDGNGPSLELVNPAMPNQYGNAWRPSQVNIGTPGAANGRYVAEAPPVISAVHHNPPIPGANQPVTITAFVIDESVTPTVTLWYRQDQEPTIAYASVAMLDDGLHGDGAAGDNVYGVVLAGLAEGQRLDFAVQASDGTSGTVAPIGHDGSFPGAGGHPPQVFLCKFSSAALPTDFPSYHLITTQYTRNRQATRDKTEYDATFLRCPATGVVSQCEVFYNATERYRGASSLYQNPPSFRIDLPGDHPMASEMNFTIKSLDMLGQQPARQGVGYGTFGASGLPHPKVHWPRFNTNPLVDGGTQNGMYSNVERINEDFFTSQAGAILPLRFPNRCSIAETVCTNDLDCPSGETCIQTDIGNCYRGRHDDASLRWEGYNPDAYRVDANERNGYQQITNEEEDNWTDLITLCDAMNCSSGDGGALCLEDTYDGWFQNNLASYADVEQWARWYAVHTLMANQEGGIYLDTGDDYFLYFWPGPTYSHATFLPWDMDSIVPAFQQTIWRTGYYNSNWPMRRFLRNNAYAGLFVGAICEYMDTAFSQASMNALIDSVPDALFPTGGNGPQTKQGMKDWVTAQRASVNSEIKRQTTLVGIPGSPYTNSNPVIALSGQLNQCWAREVRVNNLPATYNIANPDGVGANWSYNFTLTPGMNHIKVQTLNHQGVEVDRAEADVFYNPPGAQVDSLKLIAPRRMVNTKTLTLKASILNAGGGVDWSGCYSTLGTVTMNRVSDNASIPITVTFFDDHLPVPADSIRFYHGVGSVSFTLDDGAAVPAGDYKVTVTVGTTSASKVVTVLANPTWRDLQGTLSGADLVWGPDENIHIVGHDTYVPAGSTLTINPGTMIMVDSLGGLENGTLVTVNGALNAVGTQEKPIHFFSASGPAAMIHTVSGSLSNVDAWRGIHHYGSGSSAYKWVILTGAGNGPIEGHPRPPIIQVHDTHNLLVEDSIFTDSTGMMFQGLGTGTYTVRRSLVSRVGIGCEFNGNGHTLLVEDTWWTGIGRGPTTPQRYDGDLLHVDGAASNQTIRRCIIADGGDDGIDHSASTFTVDSCIIHAINDKAISMTGGFVTLRNVLIYGAGSGVRGTGNAYNSTFASGRIDSPQTVQQSIFWTSAVGGCSATINYTDGGDATHVACGTGNISADPLFTDTAQCDYSLRAGSPAQTAGPGGTRIGWLGFPVGATCGTNTDCDDDNPCTYDECVNLQCSFTPIANCSPACGVDADCSNGVFCDGVEHCLNGRCTAGTVPSCDDGIACTVDSCAAGTDECQHTPNNAACSDSNACTDDICNATAGCQHANNTASCDDGNACTANDTCSNGACVGGAPPSCNDGIACTTDVCVAPGGCQHADDCPGGQTCNHTNGACESGPATVTFQQGDANAFAGTIDTYIDTALGSQAATTPIVIDGSPVEHVLLRFDGIFGSAAHQIPQASTILSATLTLRVGSGSNDQSTNAVNFHRLLQSWVVSDVWAAYGVSPWNTEGGIQADGVDAVATADATATMTTASTAYPVDVTRSVQAWVANPTSNYGWAILPTGTDGLRLESTESTTASYRPLLTVTYYPPVAGCTTDPQCDDGLWCNGAEHCVTGTCQPGTAPNCNDGVVCTTDSCNETTDTCDHVASDAACDDGNACTDNWCDLALGCQYHDNTVSCSDGNACSTNDTCSQGICVGGTALDCNDGIACTTDTCVSPGGCQHADNCTGGLVCNLTEGICGSSQVPGLPINVGAAWRYFEGSVEPPADWTAILFDDAAWLSGPSGFGYGTDCTAQRGTTLSDMQNSYVSLYMRRQFRVDAPTSIATLNFAVDYDDAFVLYLNGTEVARRNVVGMPPSYTQLATVDHECSACDGTCNAAENIDLTNYKNLLVTGTNVLAMQGHNLTSGSSDFTMTMSMTATTGGCTSNLQCDDGLWCNGAEICNLGTGTCQAGTAQNCNDGIACTTDSCNETTNTCDHVADNVACDDTNPCTDDTCSVTVGCQHSNNTASCSDNNACTTGDLCSNGACLSGGATNCDDNVACTADSCDTALGCQHTENCPGGQTCNHTTGVCESGPVTTTFQQGDANGYAGTVDTYISAAAATTSYGTATTFTVDLSPSEMQSLLRFNGIFGSNAGQIPAGSTINSATLTLSVPSTPSNAGTAQAIYFHRMKQTWSDADWWNAFGSAPWNTTAGIQADDVEAVAAVDAAQAGMPIGQKTQIDVTASLRAWVANPASNFGWFMHETTDDAVICESSEATTQSNRPLLSVNYAPPVTTCTSDTQCGDGRYCNGAETCNLGTSTCQSGTPPVCNDGNVCTTDTCNDATGCVYTPVAAGTFCSDGLPCNGSETCDGSGVCQSGPPLVCNDSNPCTGDSCVDPAGCVYTPVAAGTSCSDGVYCNGNETCNGGGVCQAGIAVSCDDGVACTVDSCNETTDSCDHTACGMIVEAVGSRYLAVTLPAGLASVALRVGSVGLLCLPKYVDMGGLLTDAPVFRSSAEWGTVFVRGRPIVPSRAYTVQAEVTAGTPIGSGTATTWAWGDANQVNGVSVFDVLCVLDGSQGMFTKCALQADDLTGLDFTPDGVVNGDDIQAVLSGFRSLSYPDSDPCAGR